MENIKKNLPFVDSVTSILVNCIIHVVAGVLRLGGAGVLVNSLILVLTHPLHLRVALLGDNRLVHRLVDRSTLSSYSRVTLK